MAVHLSARIILACTATLFLFFPAPTRGATLSLAWDPCPTNLPVGYLVYYGVASGVYTSVADAGTNLSAEVSGLTPGLVYYLAVSAYDSNGDESMFSNEVTNAIPIPPSIVVQPQSETVIDTTAASFSAIVTGTSPLSIQWFNATAAIGGATNSSLVWAPVSTSDAGDYWCVVSNAWGVATSFVAVLTVLPTNTISTAAGVYNGLFFQTNSDGSPNVTEATAGFFGNGVVASNGAFSARIYIGGAAYPLVGTFNISGNATAFISRGALGLAGLTAVLHLDLVNGTQQLTGAISSVLLSEAWTAPLVCDLATNSCPPLNAVDLSISPGNSINSPTGYGTATGVVTNGILSVAGVFGDASAFSRSVPISKDGAVPFYVSLYNGTGLVEGWLNLAGGVVTGNLAWIRPLGIPLPLGYPLGFNTMVTVSGATFGNGLGFISASGPGSYGFARGTCSTSGWIVFEDIDGSQYYEQTGFPFRVTAGGSLAFWACAGNNNPTPSGAITVLAFPVNNPTLTSLDLNGLSGLQTLVCQNQAALTSVNASGCASLASVSCNYCAAVAAINVSDCTSLTSLSDLSSAATLYIQNSIIATLPTFSGGTHTLSWSAYAPANPIGDVASIVKGWTVIR
jgi:hypothetical protein